VFVVGVALAHVYFCHFRLRDARARLGVAALACTQGSFLAPELGTGLTLRVGLCRALCIRALDASITVMAAPQRPAHASIMGLGWPNVRTAWTLAEACMKCTFSNPRHMSDSFATKTTQTKYAP
jgi:hypothetical protein